MKTAYRTLCDTMGSAIPIFQQAWWMDAVCGDRWQALVVNDAAGRVEAAMPYLLQSKMGLRYVLQPQLTQFSGPIFVPPAGISDARRVDFIHRTADRLIDLVEGLHTAFFMQNMPPSFTDWLPFHWRGFSQTTRYTFRIDDISNPEAVFAAFDSGRERRRHIRQAERLYTVSDDLTPQQFVEMHCAYWLSRGQADLLTPELMMRVMQAAMQRHQGLILAARDASGQPVAAWFVVYDDRCAHALLSAQAATCRDGSASSLLVWQLICHLSSHTHAFDFEGSMHPSIGSFYRSFGARQVPYFCISKSANALIDIYMRRKSR